MGNIFKIALRNLFRYKRRTFLTTSLIAIGVILVIGFGGIAGSFKNGVIGILTGSNLADIQIHKNGYLKSIDNMPLDLTINSKGIAKIEGILKKNDQVKAYSKRIRFGGMLSNFSQSTNIRLTAVYPDMENQTCPGLAGRVNGPEKDPAKFAKPGEMVVPMNLARGLKLKIGSEVVLVANNKEGSVNGVSLRVGGISDNIMGPTGRDGYIHMDDAISLLRIEDTEVTQIAIKLKRFDRLYDIHEQMKAELAKIKNPAGKPAFEVTTWEQLHPFTTIVGIVDLLIIVVRVILISIVLISILNVMMMSVYERVSEVGTIASIGTPPRKILSLFLVEGLSLGLMSSIIGSAIGMALLYVIRIVKLNFTFGRMDISLSPSVPLTDVIVTILIVVIISIISTLQPAFKASRLEPVEALRHV
jgi:putative ABC transport system permease protein